MIVSVCVNFTIDAESPEDAEDQILRLVKDNPKPKSWYSYDVSCMEFFDEERSSWEGLPDYASSERVRERVVNNPDNPWRFE